MLRLMCSLVLFECVCAFTRPAAASVTRLQAGVYCLYLENDCYYVGKTVRDIEERVAEHFSGDKLQWMKKNRPIQRIDTLTSIPQDLDSWERSETIDRMKIHGASRVRGWRYTAMALSERDRETIVQDVIERHDLCRGCGEQGHLYNACKNRSVKKMATWTTAIFEDAYVPPKHFLLDSGVRRAAAAAAGKDLYASTKAATSVVEQQSRVERGGNIGDKPIKGRRVAAAESRAATPAAQMLDAVRESVSAAAVLHFVVSFAAARALRGAIGPRLLLATALVEAQLVVFHQSVRKRLPRLLLPGGLAATGAALVATLLGLTAAPARCSEARSVLFVISRLLLTLLYRNAVSGSRGKYESSRVSAMHSTAAIGGSLGVLVNL